MGETGEGSFQKNFLNTLQGIPNISTMQEHLLASTEVKEMISNMDESKILLLRGSTISSTTFLPSIMIVLWH